MIRDESEAILETERLLAFEMKEEESEAVREILLGEDSGSVILIEREVLTDAQAFSEYTRKYIQYQYGFYGYGIYCVYERETGELVGLAGFWNGRKSGEGEIGYVIKPEFRGRSYATEISMEAAAFALSEEVGFTSLIVRVDADNAASLNVARKLRDKYPVTILS